MPFLGGRVNELNGDIGGNALAERSERLVTATFRKRLVRHFLRNTRNAVFGQDAPNFLFEERNLPVSTRRGAALQFVGCAQNEESCVSYELHGIRVSSPSSARWGYRSTRHRRNPLGAHAVVGVDLDYEHIGSGSKSMLMVTASGTAVNLE